MHDLAEHADDLVARVERDGVGVVLVERLVLEQRGGERVELAAVLRSSATTSLVRLVDDAAHLVVDELAACAGETSAAPGRNGPAPSRGSTATGPIAELMPQRPTIWRAISVSCWMSDSAPVRRLAEDDLLRRAAAERDLDLRVAARARGS